MRSVVSAQVSLEAFVRVRRHEAPEDAFLGWSEVGCDVVTGNASASVPSRSKISPSIGHGRRRVIAEVARTTAYDIISSDPSNRCHQQGSQRRPVVRLRRARHGLDHLTDPALIHGQPHAGRIERYGPEPAEVKAIVRAPARDEMHVRVKDRLVCEVAIIEQRP